MIDIPFELLLKVRDNQEFVSRQLSELRPGNTILNVIDEFIIELENKCGDGEINQRTQKNYCDFLVVFKRFILNNFNSEDILTLDKKKLNLFFRQCKVKKIKAAEENQNISPYTKNAYIKYIRGLLYFAMEKGYYYHKNGKEHIKEKFRYVKTERLPKYVPDEIIREILNEVRKTQDPYRNHAIICFLISTGARVDEIVNVKVSDINFKFKQIKLTGKNNKTRVVTLYPHLEKLIRAYLNLTQIDLASNVYLFTTFYKNKENKMTVSSIQKMVKNMFNKIGYTYEYSTHCFRHTYAVNCLKAGMKIEYIAELLGHTNIDTTMIYLKLLPQDLVMEAQKYPIPLEKVLFTLLDLEDNLEEDSNGNNAD